MTIVLIIGFTSCAYLISRVVLFHIGSLRWMNLINSLMLYAPDLYKELGEPELFGLQCLWKANIFSNDRLWYRVLFKSKDFPSHPKVQKSVIAYRKFAIFELCGLAIIIAAFIVFLFLGPVIINALLKF